MATYKQLKKIERGVMSKLKDFQVATVDRIDALYRGGTRRVLVSDEVGLGKTLVARGVVAKFAVMRYKQRDDLVKIVYVCSNAAIADQNIDKLRIYGGVKKEKISDNRLSMQHLYLRMSENEAKSKDNYIQIIPITPQTSFAVGGNSVGTCYERALIWVILNRMPQLSDCADILKEVLRNGVKQGSWDWYIGYYDSEVSTCNDASGDEYVDGMTAELDKRFTSGETLSYEQIRRVCVAESCRNDRKELIRKLRLVFAQISVERLNADLVIMDEFQRFKNIMPVDGESDRRSDEIRMLTEKFFNDNVYMLLLSATPYKLYSTLEETDLSSENPYKEFCDVMGFLAKPSGGEERFESVWQNWTTVLSEFAHGGTAVISAKRKAESELYRRVCRTERLEAEGAETTLLQNPEGLDMAVADGDVRSFVELQRAIDIKLPVDFAKSCPYLLSFMNGRYKLKEKIENEFKSRRAEPTGDTLFVDSDNVNVYGEIRSNNARLDTLKRKVFTGVEQLLLWAPPSMPYYPPSYPFDGVKNFSKTLVFSCWEMVPKMISSLLSYEAERLTLGSGKIRTPQGDVPPYTVGDGEKRYPAPRLVFKLDGDRPAVMSLFTLAYPSRFLAGSFGAGKRADDPFGEVRQKIVDALTLLEREYKAADATAVDKDWYYLAPVLLDMRDDPEYVRSYFAGMSVGDDRSDEEDTDEDGEDSEGGKGRKAKVAHFYALENTVDRICRGELRPGKMPDDLADVLTLVAIGSPAVCALRTFELYAKKDGVPNSADRAGRFALSLFSRFNPPEAIAAVELAVRGMTEADGEDGEKVYWKKVLSYCVAGNLQAVLDEYAHLVAAGTAGNAYEKVCSTLTESAKPLKPAMYTVDTRDAFKSRTVGKGEKKGISFRTNFAVAFVKGENERGDRKKSVRNAFNSPFRPFVLASTSIGQEGLDFHNYCRRIVHWNLPSNPIDIEQREGRINRYKCLAVRQNVAQRYIDMLPDTAFDVWEELFALALKHERDACPSDPSDLVPYWSLTDRPNTVKIERIAPLYPFSRDGAAYERLMKILNLYRISLGQARQEELLEYIFKNQSDERVVKSMCINLSPFDRKRRNGKLLAYIGKTVDITVDRKPSDAGGDSGGTCSVVYGHIAQDSDGEQHGVYLLGVDEPTEEFRSARVIAVVVGRDGADGKLVAAPQGVLLTRKQIAAALGSREKLCGISILPRITVVRSAAAVKITKDPI